ncbi:CARDB domain-containing protein [Haloarcula marina]|uniref:CARDB domain-containing protein n=1 Tax=Haloarcula marina TaxID=2961574 RepID=UPI0020B6B49D|nr:CARDB domain-containing protein [Halomicroarcula marina]
MTARTSRSVSAVVVAALVVLATVGFAGVAAAQTASVTQSTTATTALPGDEVTLTTTFETSADTGAPQLQLEFPEGWEGELDDTDGGSASPPTGTADAFTVQYTSSGTYTVTYTVTVPEDAAAGDYTVDAEGSALVFGSGARIADTASTTITVEEPPEPANFDVSNLDAPDSAIQGDTIDVSADVTNTGDESGTQTVEFRIDTDGDGQISDESALATEDVTLNGGDSTTVDFTDIDTSGLSPGDYTHGVVSEDDSATATITIEPVPDPANFDVSNLAAPGSATQGDLIDVSADVTNTGDESATQTVEFRIDTDGDDQLDDESALASEEVTLDGGDSTTVDFTNIDTSGLTPGDYTHGVVSDDDSASASITIEPVPDPANFDVSNLDAPASATQGDTIDVSADVTNTGDETATQTIEFRIDIDGDGQISDESALATEDVTLDGGESTTVDFTDIDTSGLSPGDYTHGVVSEDDSESGQITITAVPDPANFDVSNLDAPASATQGDTIDVSADVTNTGDESATQTVEFRIDTDGDGQISDEAAVDSESLTLAGGESTTVEFTGIDTSGFSPGDYTHGVVSEDDSATGSLTIEPVPDPANFDVSNLDAPASATQGETIDVSADVTNTGDETATQTIEFRIDTDDDGEISDESALATEDVTLDGGDSTTVDFTDIDTSGLSPGDYTHGVVSDDDSATASIAIDPAPTPANFDVSNLDAPASATQGDLIDVSADVTNTGDESATQTIEFRIDTDGDGEIRDESAVATEDVTLAGGESTTVEFTDVDTSGLSPDEYTHGVVSDDDSATATITIEQANRPPTAEAGDDLTVDEETAVDLDATDSSDPDGDALTYSWTETTSSGVSLTDSDTATPTFTAPTVDSATTLTFEVTVTDESGATDTDIVNVTVEPVTDDEDEEMAPIGEFENPPQDLDDDGLYADINGNGEVNLVDVQALFVNQDDPTVQNNPANFDFSGNGEFNLVDVQALFAELTED